MATFHDRSAVDRSKRMGSLMTSDVANDTIRWRDVSYAARSAGFAQPRRREPSPSTRTPPGIDGGGKAREFPLRGRPAPPVMPSTTTLERRPSRNVLRRKPSSIAQHAAATRPRGIAVTTTISQTRSTAASPVRSPSAPASLSPASEAWKRSEDAYNAIFTPTRQMAMTMSPPPPPPPPPIIPELDRYHHAGRPSISGAERSAEIDPPAGHERSATAAETPSRTSPLPYSNHLIFGGGNRRYSGCSASGYSASPSIGFSESPGPGAFSRNTTPTSMSSQSPSIAAPTLFGTAMSKPLSRRAASPAGILVQQRPVPVVPTVVPAAAGSTVMSDGRKKTQKEAKTPPMPSLPPPRKSSQKFTKRQASAEKTSVEKTSAETSIEKTSAEQPSLARVLKTKKSTEKPRAVVVLRKPSSSKMIRAGQTTTTPPPSIPSRPSRQNTPELRTQQQRGDDEAPRSIITSQHALAKMGFPSEKPMVSMRPRPQLQHEVHASSSSSIDIRSRRVSRLPSPSPTLPSSSLRPMDPSARSPAPPSRSPSPGTSRSRFGLFRRAKPVDEDKDKNRPARKGPAAGTGHEGYGRFGLRARSTSAGRGGNAGGEPTTTTTTAMTTTALSSMSTSTSTSTSRRLSASSQTSSASNDPFLLERMSPVIIAGGGEIVENRNVAGASDLSRTDSSQSLPFSLMPPRPSMESRTSSVSSRGGGGGERTTMWPTIPPRDPRRLSGTSTSQTTSLRDARKTPIGSAAPSGTTGVASSSDLEHATKSTPSSKKPRKTKDVRDKNQVSPTKPPRWNIFSRTKTTTTTTTPTPPTQTTTGSSLPPPDAIRVTLGRPVIKPMPHYALLDSSDEYSPDTVDLDEIMRADEAVVALTNDELDALQFEGMDTIATSRRWGGIGGGGGDDKDHDDNNSAQMRHERHAQHMPLPAQRRIADLHDLLAYTPPDHAPYPLSSAPTPDEARTMATASLPATTTTTATMTNTSMTSSPAPDTLDTDAPLTTGQLRPTHITINTDISTSTSPPPTPFSLVFSSPETLVSPEATPNQLHPAPPSSSRPSRLQQVGRIPKVVPARSTAATATAAAIPLPAASPISKSFSRPFARFSIGQRPPSFGDLDVESIAKGGPTTPPMSVSSRMAEQQVTRDGDDHDAEIMTVSLAALTGDLPHPSRASTSIQSTSTTSTTMDPTTMTPFLRFAPRKDSAATAATTSSSSGGSGTSRSYVGTTAIVRDSQASLVEDEVWREYDDLVEPGGVVNRATGGNGPLDEKHRRQDVNIGKRHGLQHVSAGDKASIARRSSMIQLPSPQALRNSNVTVSSRYSQDDVLDAPPPPSPLRSRRSQSLQMPSRASHGSGASRSSTTPSSRSTGNFSGIQEPVVANTPAALVNLRVGSMHVSKWLTFGHVLFSPAEEEIMSSGSMTAKTHSVLVIDGLGNDDWSFYAAETYPSATFYNLSPSHPMPPTSPSPSPAHYPLTPPNHRQIHHASPLTRFPFPSSTFLIVMFRFPACMPETHYRALVAEARRVLRPGGYLELAVLDLDMMNMGPRARRCVRALKEDLRRRRPRGGAADVEESSVNNNNDLVLGSASDVVMRCIAKKGFVGVRTCRVGVPVTCMTGGQRRPDAKGSRHGSRVGSTASGRGDTTATGTKASSRHRSPHTPSTSSSSSSSISSRTPSDEPSFSQMLNDTTHKGDVNISRMVAKVGRWWYQRCYESVLSESDVPDSPTIDVDGGRRGVKDTSSSPSVTPSIFTDPAVLRECEAWCSSFKLVVAYAQKPLETVTRRRTASV